MENGLQGRRGVFAGRGASGSKFAVLHRNAIWISRAIAQGLSRLTLLSSFASSGFSLGFSRLNACMSFPLERNPAMAARLL